MQFDWCLLWPSSQGILRWNLNINDHETRAWDQKRVFPFPSLFPHFRTPGNDWWHLGESTGKVNSRVKSADSYLSWRSESASRRRIIKFTTAHVTAHYERHRTEEKVPVTSTIRIRSLPGKVIDCRRRGFQSTVQLAHRVRNVWVTNSINQIQ
jgi:hypothetical protein